MDSQGFADGFAWIRESSQWIRMDSRKFTMDSHGFAKVCTYTPIRTDSRKFTKVRNRFTLIRGWIRKDSRKFTYGFAPIHKDSHPIIQSNHGGIRELGQLRQFCVSSTVLICAARVTKIRKRKCKNGPAHTTSMPKCSKKFVLHDASTLQPPQRAHSAETTRERAAITQPWAKSTPREPPTARNGPATAAALRPRARRPHLSSSHLATRSPVHRIGW